MSWSVWLIRGEETSDITGQVRVGSIAAGITSSPTGIGMEFETLGGEIEGQPIGAEVQIRDGELVIYRGIINAVDRGDAGSIAGQHPATRYICTDIFGALKSTLIPIPEPNSVLERATERPPKFRQRVRKGNPDPAKPLGEPGDATKNLTVPQMFAWALDLIEDLESAKANRLPTISLSTENVSGTPLSDGEPFAFNKYFPIIADTNYWDLLNDIATFAGQGWSLDPIVDPEGGSAFQLRTWNAIERDAGNTATYEFADAEGVSAAVEGAEVKLARTLAITEDASTLVNSVRVIWEKPVKGKPGLITEKVAYVKDTASVAEYGERMEEIVTDFHTVQMARAAGLRKIGASKNPNMRGNARVPWDPAIRPGVWVNLHRTDHPGDHDGHYDAYAWITTIRPVFEPGYRNPETGAEEPTWVDIDFNTEPYEVEAFKPFIPEARKPRAAIGASNPPAGTSGPVVVASVQLSAAPFIENAGTPVGFVAAQVQPLAHGFTSGLTATLTPLRRQLPWQYSVPPLTSSRGGGIIVPLVFTVLTRIPKATSVKSCQVYLGLEIDQVARTTLPFTAAQANITRVAVFQLKNTARPLGDNARGRYYATMGNSLGPLSIGPNIVGSVRYFSVEPGMNRLQFSAQLGSYVGANELFGLYANYKTARFVVVPVADNRGSIENGLTYHLGGDLGAGTVDPTVYHTWDRTSPTEIDGYPAWGYDLSNPPDNATQCYALVHVSGSAGTTVAGTRIDEFEGTDLQYSGRRVFSLSALAYRAGLKAVLYSAGSSSATSGAGVYAKDISEQIEKRLVGLADPNELTCNQVDITDAVAFGLLKNQRLVITYRTYP